MTQKGSPRPTRVEAGQTGILILVGILIIVAIGGAYYFGTQKGGVPITSKPSLFPTASPALIGSAETANWKTYTNILGKFFL